MKRDKNKQGHAQREQVSRKAGAFNFTLLSTAIAVQGVLSAASASAQPALPQGAAVVHGQVSVSTTGQSMNVTTGSPASVINWQSFSVGREHSVHFQQPNASSQVLNRVLGQDPSNILGSLSSNGHVWLINPNGVLFGQGARVDVGGLVASTLDITDSDFLAGRRQLREFVGTDAKVVNDGTIRTPFGGRVFLVGQGVENQGSIQTPGGQTALVSGTSVDLVDSATPYLTLRVESRHGEVINTGSVSSGRIDMHGAVVKQDGALQANEMALDASGTIVLRATRSATLGAGSTTVAAGGLVNVQAAEVTVAGRVDVSNTSGGGTVSIGGTPWAEGGARVVRVESGAVINADGTQQGNGGTVALWSEDLTHVAGSITARGGAQGGDGGFIETSAARQLDLLSTPDASAPMGRAGEWLIDPYNLTIVAGTGSTNASGLTATGDSATVGADLITAALNAGTSVTVSTGNPTGGTQQGDLTVAAAINATTPISGGAPTLSLNAQRNITLNSTASITANAAGGALNVSLNANQGGGGGAAFMSGDVDLNGGRLTTTSTATFSSGSLLRRAEVASSNGSGLRVTGSATFDDVLLDIDTAFSTSASSISVPNRLTLAAGRTLTVGGTSSALRFSGLSGLLTGAGTVALDATAGGMFSTGAGASFTIDSGITVSSGVAGGTIGSANTSFVNRGTIRANAGATTLTGINWVNEGVVEAAGGTVNLSGTVQSEDIGTVLNTAGTVRLSGTLENSGRVWDLGRGGNQRSLTIQGGRVNGGEIASSTAAELDIRGATLDGVTLDVDTATLSGSISVPNQLTVAAGRTLSLSNTADALRFTNAAGLLTGTGTLAMTGSGTDILSTAVGGSFTIDSDMTVLGGVSSIIGSANTSFVNRGTIRANAGTTTLTGINWVNEGVIESAGGSVNLSGTVQSDELGTVLNTAGVVRLVGTLENSGRVWDLGRNGNQRNLTIQGGRVNGGEIASSTAAELDIRGAMLDGVTLNVDAATFNGSISVPGELTVAAGRTLSIGTTFDSLRFTGMSGLLTGEGTVAMTGSGSDILSTTAGGSFTIDSDIAVVGGISSSTIGSANTSFVNRGTIRANTGTTTLTGINWVNEGVVEASGGSVTLSGTVQSEDLGTVLNTAGTVRLSGTLENSGRVWDLGRGGNQRSLTIQGGRVNSGEIASSTAAELVVNSSATLDGVTLNVDTATSSGFINVPNQLTVAAGRTLSLSATSDELRFTGTSGLLTGAGTVAMTGSSSDLYSTAAGSSFTIDGGMTVLGGVFGTIGRANTSFVNRGTIRANSGTTNFTGINWANEGVVEVAGGVVNLAGTVQSEDLGTVLNTGGTVHLSGTLENSGRVWDLGRGGNLRDVTIQNGRVNGGEIASSTSAELVVNSSATLDGVTLNVDTATSSGSINVPTQLTVAAGRTLNIGTTFDTLRFTGLSGLLTGAGTVAMTGPGSDMLAATAGSSFTIDNDMTVLGGVSSTIGSANTSFVNRGTIRSNAGTTTFTGINWANEGLVEVAGGAVNLAGTMQSEDLGTILNTAGTVRLTGTLENSGRVWDLGRGGNQRDVTIQGGRVNGGEISSTTSAELAVRSSATLDSVTLNVDAATSAATISVPTQLTVAAGRTLSIGTTFDTLRFTGPSGLLTGAGTVAMTGSGSDMIAATAGSSFTIDNDMTVVSGLSSSTIGSSNTSFVNRGTIRAGTGSIALTGTNWVNEGLVETLGGSVSLAGTVQTEDLGTLRNTAGTIQLTGTLENSGRLWDLGRGGNTGALTLGSGRINGGEISSSTTANLRVSGSPTLDGVRLNVDTAMLENSNVYLPNELRIEAGRTLSQVGRSSIIFTGDNGLLTGEGSVEMRGSVSFMYARETDASFTIDSGITVSALTNNVIGVNGSSFVNNGLIRNDSARLSLRGEWQNQGTVQTVDGLTTVEGTFNRNDGLLETIQGPSGGTMVFSTRNAEIINAASGVLRGDGTFAFNGTVVGSPAVARTLVNAGTIDPGVGLGGVGLLSITGGDVRQEATGLLNIDLAGTGVGLADRLNVVGNLTLDGALQVQENGVFAGSTSGYFAEVGDSFPAMLNVTGSQTGALSTFTQPQDVVFAPVLDGGLGITATTASTTRWAQDASGEWSTAALWSRGTPTAGKDAVIDRGAATPTVTVSAANAVARSLQINEALAVDGRTLRIGGGQIDGSVSLLSGASLVTDASLGGSGLLAWSSGTIGGDGSLGFLGGGNFGFSGSGDRVIDNPNITFSFTDLDLPQGSLTLRNGGLTFNTSALGATRVGAGASLLVEGGRMTNNGPMQIGGFLGLYGGRLDGNGTFDVAGGTLDLPQSSTLDWAATGALVNTGTLQLAGRTITNPFTNNGSVVGGNGLTFSQAFTNTGSYTQASGTVNFEGGFTQSAGSFQLGNGGGSATAVVGPAGMQILGGELRGAGTIQGNVEIGAASLRVGFSPGSLAVVGDLGLSAESVTDIEVGGTGAGQFDSIAVSGTATLSGTLNVLGFGGYTPAVGDTVAYLSHGAVVGDFAGVNFVAPTDGWDLPRVVSAAGQQLGAGAVLPPAPTPTPTPTVTPAPVLSTTPDALEPTLSAPDLQTQDAMTGVAWPSASNGDATVSPTFSVAPDDSSPLQQVAMLQARTEGSASGASAAIFDTTGTTPASSSSATGAVAPHRYLFSDGDQQYFRVLPVSDMAPADIAGVLDSRKEYKKALFAEAIAALKKNPALPDVPACGGGQASSSGACIAAADSAQPAEVVGGVAGEAASVVVQSAIPQIGRKIALMVGVNRYDDKRIPQLINALPDAQAVGQTMASQLGYDVVRLDNPSKAELIGALNTLVNQARESDSLVVYFAGHGELVDATGFGYWIPRDANAQDARTWVSNADINRLLAMAGSRQIAVLADSCYSGSFARESSLSGQQATQQLDTYLNRRAVTIMTSGGDEPVADSGRNGHSVFAWSLMQQLRKVDGWQPGVSLFNAVQVEVERELPQTPMYGASLSAGHQEGGDFLFERRSPGR